MEESLKFATLFMQLLPVLIPLYDKIVENNKEAGLVPADQLIAEGRQAAADTQAAAQAELDKLK